MLRCSSRLLCPQLTCNLAQVHCSCFFSRHSTDQLHRLNILAAADAGSYRLSSSSSSWNNPQPCMVRDCRSWATTNTLTHSTQQQYSFNLLATRGSHSIADGCTMLPARCHTQVQLLKTNWASVLKADLSEVPSVKVPAGYQRLKLPGKVQVLLVEEEAHLGGALQALRDSMQDPVVAIDLEFEHLQSRPIRVAMMQLASSRVAVLIRTCRMDNKLPKVLRKFLQEPSVCLLGCGWASTDEVIMQRTFGISRKDFGRFLDLQEVGGLFGLQEVGLKQLTRHVLGLELNKNSRGNWEAQRLKPSKVKYAALDVLVAGQVFRKLLMTSCSLLHLRCWKCTIRMSLASTGAAAAQRVAAAPAAGAVSKGRKKAVAIGGAATG